MEKERRRVEEQKRDAARSKAIEEQMRNCDPQLSCIDGFANVRTPAGVKLIKDVRIGDPLMTCDGTFEIVTKIGCEWNPVKKMCNVNGVRLSHNHPVLVDSVWCFPSDVAPVYVAPVIVHNFELQGPSHTIIVNDTLICATMGKGPAQLSHRNPTHDEKYGSGWWKSDGHLKYDTMCEEGRIISKGEHICKLYALYAMKCLPNVSVFTSTHVDELFDSHVASTRTIHAAFTAWKSIRSVACY